MNDHDYEPRATGTTTDSLGVGALHMFEILFRWLTRLLGFVLVLTGLYATIHVFSAVGQAVHDPKTLEPAVTGMAQLINSESLEVTISGEKLVLGRPVAAVVLLLWYVVWAWLAIAVLTTGAKLVFAVMKERREFLTAMKEFMLTARQEGMFREPGKVKPGSDPRTGP